jgi:hypothetical protein
VLVGSSFRMGREATGPEIATDVSVTVVPLPHTGPRNPECGR